jgi:hypothetical protein
MGKLNIMILEDIPVKSMAGMDVTNKKNMIDIVVIRLNGNKIPRNINIIGIVVINSNESISGALSIAKACII